MTTTNFDVKQLARMLWDLAEDESGFIAERKAAYPMTWDEYWDADPNARPKDLAAAMDAANRARGVLCALATAVTGQTCVFYDEAAEVLGVFETEA